MIINFYRIISNFLSPVIFLFFFTRLLSGKETLESFLQKFTIYGSSTNFILKKKTIWINAVSIGEAKVGVLLAQKIKKKFSSLNVVLSTSTISSYKLLKSKKNNFPIIFAPVDISFIIKRFINYWKPNFAIFVESEIWPSTFHILNESNIKLQIVNARISEQSFLNWKRVIFFSKNLFKLVDNYFVQDKSSASRLKKLGVKKITKISNLKYLQKQQQINKREFKKFNDQLKGKFVITIFSSHKGEEELIISCFENLKKTIKNIFLVIIPRHVERAKQIRKLFHNKLISYSIRSKKDNFLKDKDIIIIDTFGEIPLFFKLSKIVIVGGSFADKGGQNPIEASYYNSPVVFGPSMFNFSEIAEKMRINNAGLKVENSKQLEEIILSLKINNSQRLTTAKNFSKLCKKERKDATKNIDEILESLNA